MNKSGGVQKTTSNTLQKIFPHTSKGFAIAHHGENIINETPVKKIASQFLANNTAEIDRTSVQGIAQLFEQQYGKDIQNTLAAVSDRKFETVAAIQSF